MRRQEISVSVKVGKEFFKNLFVKEDYFKLIMISESDVSVKLRNCAAMYERESFEACSLKSS